MPDPIPSLRDKQERIRSVLDRLASAQPPQIGVRLFSRAAGGAPLRGLINPHPGAPLPPMDSSQLPPRFAPERLERRAASLRLGEELHIVIDAPRRGYLHVFNLGTGGDARKLLPEAGAQGPVENGRAYLASPGAGVTPFFAENSREEAWIEHGPANGFPERVLAIIAAEDRLLAASCLNPAWSDTAGPEPAMRGGFSAPSIEPLLHRWPASLWSWGLGEIPVIA